MRILMTCGGTGGHINPAIAIAGTIKNNIPKADMSEWNPVSATILAVKENYGDYDLTLDFDKKPE